MKRTILYLSVAFLLGCGSLFAQPSVSVKKGKVSVNGVTVTPGWQLKPLLDKLGAGYRLYDGYNRVYTYDAYGLAFFEKQGDNGAGSNELLEIQVFFAPIEGNIPPKYTFAGTATVENVKLGANLAAQNLLPQLKKYKQTESYTEHNYRLAYKGVYVYFLFNDSEQGLVKVSVGPDRR